MASSSAGTGTTTPSAGAFWKSGRRGFAGASTRGPASRSSRSRTRTSSPVAPPTRWPTWPHKRACPIRWRYPPDRSPKAPQRVPGAPGALHALRRGPGGTGEGPVRQSPPGGSREAGIQEATDEKLRKAVQTVVRSAPRLRDLQAGGYFCLRLYIIPYWHPCGV